MSAPGLILQAIGPAPHDGIGTGCCALRDCPRPAVLSSAWSGTTLCHCPPHFAERLGPELAALTVDALGRLLGAAGIVLRYVLHAPDGGIDLDAGGRVVADVPSRGWSVGASGVFLPDERVASVRGAACGDDLGASIAEAIADAADRAAIKCITQAIAQTGTLWISRAATRAVPRFARRVVDKVTHGRIGDDRRTPYLVVDYGDGSPPQELLAADFVLVAAPPQVAP